MNFLFQFPSSDDLQRLLSAWRWWLIVTLIGGVIGAIVYFIAPPPYRAAATVVVDFNIEENFPVGAYADRDVFYALEREARKLEEFAWSDTVLLSANVIDQRDQLNLSQPADGAWHFYADDADPQQAQMLASSWAKSFVDQSKSAQSITPHVGITTSQVENIPVVRRSSFVVYIFSGASLMALIGALFCLFFPRPFGRGQGEGNEK
jgi:hypothetical protein